MNLVEKSVAFYIDKVLIHYDRNKAHIVNLASHFVIIIQPFLSNNPFLQRTSALQINTRLLMPQF